MFILLVDWAYVEEFVRSLVDLYPDVWVWTGELFLPQKGEDGKFYVKYQVCELGRVCCMFIFVLMKYDHCR
jgi:DNA/RNA non-specific endonuclease